MRKLKLIWDFHGPNAYHIAQHHKVHLKEYIQLKQLDITIVDTEILSDFHVIAFLVVNENAMKPIRDALKPHRGQVYDVV